MSARRKSADVLADQVFDTPAPAAEQPRRRVTRLNHGPTRVERKNPDSADILAEQITGVAPR